MFENMQVGDIAYPIIALTIGILIGVLMGKAERKQDPD